MEYLRCKSNEYEIDLALRNRCTIICGDSATGKTFLFQILKNIENLKGVYTVNYSSVKSYENYYATVDYIKRSAGKIIIIDQADDVQTLYNDELMYAINIDSQNTFIIIGRAPKLVYNYSDVAEISIENNRITLRYLMPEPLF